jgi:hypothetical protein
MQIETNYPQEVEFKASVSLETNRIPDPYHYILREGKLFSPVTEEPVEASITRRTPVEEAEYRAFQKIQGWASSAEQGLSVWISPEDPQSGYEATKIIFSDIVYDFGFRKLLRNRAVCLDWSLNESILFSRSLGASGGNLRENPVFLQESFDIADILAPHAPRQASLIRKGEDFIIKEKLKAGLAMGWKLPIGPFAPSCGRIPGSAFGAVFADSLNLSEGYFDCPRCKGPIPSGRGITTCPHCGVRKEDCSGGCE